VSQNREAVRVEGVRGDLAGKSDVRRVVDDERLQSVRQRDNGRQKQWWHPDAPIAAHLARSHRKPEEAWS
jgi:hypothetical protein